MITPDVKPVISIYQIKNGNKKLADILFKRLNNLE